jgi:prepilin-type N-terminal cleavage/methylation domain-containing protein/prepilin-type processing-associated H-X9-DG protein
VGWVFSFFYVAVGLELSRLSPLLNFGDRLISSSGTRLVFMKKSSNKRTTRRGFTLTELLIVIAIIAVLASLATMGAMRMRASAGDTKCINNLRQIGTALGTYVTENSGNFPYSNDPSTLGFSHWSAPLPKLLNVGEGSSAFPKRADYEKASAVHPFNCPTCKTRFRTYAANMNALCFLGQGGNYKMRNMAVVPNLANLVLMADDTQGDPSPNNNGKGVFDSNSYTRQIGIRHTGKKANMLFGDFHVEARTRESLDSAKNILPPY